MVLGHKKKLLASLIGILFIVSIILAGCGSTASTTSNSQPAAKPADQSAAKPAEQAQAAAKPAAVTPDYEFFKGKTLKFIVATDPGGGYDGYARLIAPYLQKYLPGSTVIVENDPGAGHIIGATKIYESKPDGLTIGTFNSGLIQQQIIGNKNIKFDLGKFTWLSKSTTAIPVIITGKNSPYKTFDALKQAKDPVKFGGAGVGSEASVDPLIMGKVFNIPVKIIDGYGGSKGDLAIMKGELDAMEGTFDSEKSLLDQGGGQVVLQMGAKKSSELPNVPWTADLVKDNPQGQSLLAAVAATAAIGKPIAAPPGMAPERTAALVEALKKAYADPELKDKAAKLELTLDPEFGSDVSKMVTDALKQTPENVTLLTQIITGKN